MALDNPTNKGSAIMVLSPAGALKEFQGAIVAITHNRSFAESLNAT
jgi:ATPase subunit of ABC transporter with duplicated ATPase domains